MWEQALLLTPSDAMLNFKELCMKRGCGRSCDGCNGKKLVSGTYYPSYSSIKTAFSMKHRCVKFSPPLFSVFPHSCRKRIWQCRYIAKPDTDVVTRYSEMIGKMGRQPCEKIGLKRGPWTIEEDYKLVNHILNNGFHCWRIVPKLAGLSRCGKSCRLRWTNYLRPDLKRGPLSEMEENQIIQLHSRLGNKWSKIAAHFPGRTDNEIKNHWNTRIKKRLKLLGLDSLTPNPICRKKKQKTETLIEDVETKKVPLINSKGETSNISSNYEMLCGNFDVKFMLNQESNIASTSTCSSSLSSEEKFNGVLGEPHSNDQDNYLQQWVDSFDSCLSWDGFNNLDQDLHFFETSAMNMP